VKRIRRHPRYPTRRLVELTSDDGAATSGWMTDISCSGMFVEIEAAPLPQVGSVVRVWIDDSVVEIALEARVARRAEAPAGVGLEVLRIMSPSRDAFDRLVERLAPDHITHPETNDLGTFDYLRRFRIALEGNHLYGAIGAQPTDSEETIAECIDATRRIFASQAAHSALEILSRIEMLMSDPQSRLEYDLREGHVNAEERIAKAAGGSGLSVEVLRETWFRLFPKRRDRSRELVQRALLANRSGDQLGELRVLQAAIDLDPFNTALRQALSVRTPRFMPPVEDRAGTRSRRARA
jgi:hypothetical protein